jgi:2-succinyl-5-enolpyruvyl-6-hydroxy-3-cyclohexene-1-carboxylate synthase
MTRSDRGAPGAREFSADPAEVYSFVGRFFDSLRAAGVEHVVISPGSRSTPLSITADRNIGLRTWIELDERSAGFFALGLARATRRPAVLICTSGTAAANYLPVIVEAHYSRVPLIVLTADRPPELRDWGAGQTIEQAGIYGRYPRWTVEVPVPTAGGNAIRYAGQLGARAVEMAIGAPAGLPAGPGGVVHLNWPLREPLAPSIESASETESTLSEEVIRFTRGRVAAEPADVRELVALVRSHERGVICSGPMDAEPELVEAIAGFACASGWPVLADPASQLRSADRSMGAAILDMGDALTRAPGFAAKRRPEVVLRIGDTPVSKAQQLWIESTEPDSVWWLDEGGHWGEPSHRATRVIRGGGASLLALATAELEDHVGRDSAWCRSLEELNTTARKVMSDVVHRKDAWSGLSVAAAICRRMPSGSLLFTSNSMSIRLLDLAFANRSGRLRTLCNRGASGIDGITSTALGIAAAACRPTLLLTGDLAFLHDLGGLLLARHESIPLTIVVLDDNGGGIFSFLPVASQQEAVGFDRLFRTPHDLDLSRAAALFELEYRLVESEADLESALDQALERPVVSIVHVRVDASDNESRFRECVARVCEAVDAEVES